MSVMIRKLIANKDYSGIRKVLALDPSLADKGIPFDEKNTIEAHPLHRICDGVFNSTYTDEEAVEMAKIFLEYGAHIEGFGHREQQDTPLIAAASLHAEQTAILYIDHGAGIHYAGCHGGTALHWAAWTGQDRLVQRLIEAKAEINRLCIDFKSTPLLWAVHGYKLGGETNRHHQVECVRLLLAAGADKSIPNVEGKAAIEFLDEGDGELLKLLR